MNESVGGCSAPDILTVEESRCFREAVEANLKAECVAGFAKLDGAKIERWYCALRQGQPEDRITVILDFDSTITAAGVSECHELIRESPELPESFRAELRALYGTFRDGSHARLGDPHAFWEDFRDIIVRHDLTEDMFDAALIGERARRGESLLRPGVADLFSVCAEHGVPVVVLSAGVAQVIRATLRVEGVTLPTFSWILSNELCFDSAGRCVDVMPRDPPASRAGKLRLLSQVTALAARPCILAVGDKPGDAAVGSSYPRPPDGSEPFVLAVGFLNEAAPTEATMQEYEQAFDVLPHDGATCTFRPLASILKQVLQPLETRLQPKASPL